MDVIARIMADAMQPGLGQPIIVDNKPGGMGMLGVNDLLGAPRDGYTVMLHLNGAVSESRTWSSRASTRSRTSSRSRNSRAVGFCSLVDRSCKPRRSSKRSHM